MSVASPEHDALVERLISKQRRAKPETKQIVRIILGLEDIGETNVTCPVHLVTKRRDTAGTLRCNVCKNLGKKARREAKRR